MGLDYKASGTLVEHAQTRDNGVYVILAKIGTADADGTHGTPTPYVVSRYRLGEREWFAGSYCSNIVEAAKEFQEMAVKHA